MGAFGELLKARWGTGISNNTKLKKRNAKCPHCKINTKQIHLWSQMKMKFKWYCLKCSTYINIHD